MKKISPLLFFICLNTSVLYGQNDTITIYKVNYFELNIPAGWEKYILKSKDSLIEFYSVESSDTSFRNMLSINPNTKKGNKLIKELQDWNNRKDIKPLQYKDIGLLFIQSYQIIGTLNIRNINAVLIDSVIAYSQNNIDIEDLKSILELFN